MVGRFVEEQGFRPAEERLGEQHADLLAALQLRHLPLVHVVGNIETGEQHRGVAFGRVTVVFADRAFEFAEAHAVGVGERVLRVEGVPFLERRPERRVAHDHGVDDAELVEGVLVLAQHAEPGRAQDRAALRRLFAGQQLHEGGLARAVRSGEAVATPRLEHRRYVVEEHLVAEAHRHAADGNHLELSCGGLAR